jgi:RNA polymerase sigma-70 factor (ECF subfamily)
LSGGHREAVGDVVQETFLAAARSARTFDPTRGSLRSWLLGIVHWETVRQWRRRQRDADRDGARSLDGAGAEDPTAALLRAEQAAYVRRILAEMPADYAWLLVAKYVDDRPVASLCTELAAGAEAVRSKLARARRLFRNAMTRERIGQVK